MGNRTIIELHEGLWRIWTRDVTIPLKKRGRYAINSKNLEAGRVHVDPKRGIIQSEYVRKTAWDFQVEWNEVSHWAYDDKTGEVWRICIDKNTHTVNERKLCAVVPKGTTPFQVQLKIEDRDITVRDEWSSQDEHRKTTLYHHSDYQVKWSVEMDGKSILALVAVKPKMSYAEILNIIVNEGGSVDSNGIIHRP